MGYDDTDEKVMAYDLRQIYAQKIIGPWLEYINDAAEGEDFQRWFKGLKNLKTKIDKALSVKEEGFVEQRYDELLKALEKNESAYLRTSSDPIEKSKVEEALRDYEEVLMKLMEKHNMFGGKYDDSGL